MLEVIEDMRRRAATPPSPPRPGGDVWGRFRMLNRSGAAIHVISRKRSFGCMIAGGLYSVTARMVVGEHFTMITRSGILFCVDCGWAWFGILGFVSHRWISYCGCSSHQWDQLLKLPRVFTAGVWCVRVVFIPRMENEATGQPTQEGAEKRR